MEDFLDSVKSREETLSKIREPTSDTISFTKSCHWHSFSSVCQETVS